LLFLWRYTRNNVDYFKEVKMSENDDIFPPTRLNHVLFSSLAFFCRDNI
jgi:hypothetical protein